MPDSKALGLVCDVESDRLRVFSSRKLIEVSSRRQMLSVLASQFDTLGILAPYLFKFFKQVNDIAMGSYLAPAVADIFMNWFIDKAQSQRNRSLSVLCCDDEVFQIFNST